MPAGGAETENASDGAGRGKRDFVRLPFSPEVSGPRKEGLIPEDGEIWGTHYIVCEKLCSDVSKPQKVWCLSVD